jgi:hypothetical protein
MAGVTARTFARPALHDAAADTFNSIKLPAGQLVEAAAASELARKSRFADSVEVRTMQVPS